MKKVRFCNDCKCEIISGDITLSWENGGQEVYRCSDCFKKMREKIEENKKEETHDSE